MRHQVLELDWNTSSHVATALQSSPGANGFDLILASDVTYQSELHLPLARVIKQLLRRPSENRTSGIALIAHETRLSDIFGKDIQLNGFLCTLTDMGFHVNVSDLHVPQEGSSGALVQVSFNAHDHTTVADV